MSFRTRRKVMFTVLSLVYMMVFLHGVAMTVFAKDLMRDMDLNQERMGMLGSAYLYAYAVVMLVSGMIAAWAGPRRTLAVLFLVSGTGGIVFAMSDSLSVAMLGRAMSGVGLAGTMTSSFTLFGRWYPPSDYSRVCGYFFAIGGMGAMAGIGLLAPLNQAVGWRAVFAGIGVLTLFYAFLLFLAIRDWPPGDALIDPGQSGMKQEDYGMAVLWRSVKRVARSWDFWRLAGWFLALPGIYFAFNGLWAVPYLKDVYGMSDTEAGMIVSLAALGFIVGSPVIAWLSDRVIRSYRLPLGLSGVLTVAGFAVLVWRIDMLGTASLVALVLAFGIAMNSPNVCAYASARNLFGTRMAGITGGVFGCSAFIGGALMQIVSGALLDYAKKHAWAPASGYALAFSPFLLLGAVAAVVGFTLSPASFGAAKGGK